MRVTDGMKRVERKTAQYCTVLVGAYRDVQVGLGRRVLTSVWGA